MKADYLLSQALGSFWSTGHAQLLSNVSCPGRSSPVVASPFCMMSASRSHRWVFFGLPIFLVPSAFQVKPQGLSRNVTIGLSQGVANPSSLRIRVICESR